MHVLPSRHFQSARYLQSRSLSLMRLPLFFHLFHLDSTFSFECFYPIYHITSFLLSLCPYPSPLSQKVPNLAIHGHFPCRLAWGNMVLMWIWCVSQICQQDIMHWPSVIAELCCLVPTLGHGSSVDCIAVDRACLCCVSSVPTLIVPLFSILKRLSMRRICRRLDDVLMGSHYPNLVCR